MTRMLVNTKIRFQKALEARQLQGDAGQGTLEYVGMVIVAVILVVAVVGILKGAGLDKELSTQIDKLKGAFSG